VTQPVPAQVLPSPRFPKANLIQTIAAITNVQVFWRTDPNPYAGQAALSEHAWVRLFIQSTASVGVDELRQSWDATANQNDSVQVGQRQFTLVVRAESYDETLEAYDLCERVRFRIRTQTARAIWAADGTLSLRDIQPTVVLPDQVEDVGGIERTLLVASMDVRWNWVAVADPLDPSEGNWIEYVDGSNCEPGSPIIPGTTLP
jgi:hypothetical protein